jgi:hypothetical protein
MHYTSMRLAEEAENEKSVFKYTYTIVSRDATHMKKERKKS